LEIGKWSSMPNKPVIVAQAAMRGVAQMEITSASETIPSLGAVTDEQGRF
jgi:hypothetical protein